jgi:hypothetical protein
MLSPVHRFGCQTGFSKDFIESRNETIVLHGGTNSLLHGFFQDFFIAFV